ncbi:MULTISPECIES: flagellar biosynthetic protein FliR [unclassified Sphingomonas]|uniref:flagellar biosynthetic protein FliR n=1 Tax=unclassified Sphingomonas TaxID=196159 RepID=UPI000926B30F|nr:MULTISPECIES: flagellar biosynthetic protein FliR [unclassified Sphingomonas]MBN8847858.1 flagellar biosynthetic protein FliR [Sphingomonas sp.]OJV33467.1 MAG: flagellar biosynthetic protein FliR [Sphingomonas sp. 67-36]QKR98991.1 flagellar biosynthetic protein FliR [Sphingomonas sp. CL5.1]
MLGFGLAIEPQLWALIFVMVRVGSAFVAAPVFGNLSVPLPVRVALSGAIGVLVLASHPIQPPAQIFAVTTFLSVAAEALVGLALGFVLQIAFAAPLVAGEVIGGSMGIGFANMLDPNSGRSSPAIGQFLSVMLTLLFLSLDGHLVLVDMILRSYTALPPGAAWLATGQMRDIAMFGGYTFLAGLLLALPVGFLLLCLNLVVGMLSRSAPALNLFAVGLPASLAVGVVSLAIAFPAMGDYMQVMIREALAATSSLVLG